MNGTLKSSTHVGPARFISMTQARVIFARLGCIRARQTGWLHTLQTSLHLQQSDSQVLDTSISIAAAIVDLQLVNRPYKHLEAPGKPNQAAERGEQGNYMDVTMMCGLLCGSCAYRWSR